MKTEYLRIAAIVLLPLALAACMATTPNVDAHLGEAATDMRHAQVLNPAASGNRAVPSGMDGVAAKSAYEQYQKSYKAPEKNTTSFTIGVGR
jgi:hypothetical protein